jgi:hypothetical protein
MKALYRSLERIFYGCLYQNCECKFLRRPEKPAYLVISSSGWFRRTLPHHKLLEITIRHKTHNIASRDIIDTLSRPFKIMVLVLSAVFDKFQRHTYTQVQDCFEGKKTVRVLHIAGYLPLSSAVTWDKFYRNDGSALGACGLRSLRLNHLLYACKTRICI